jgi:hypothetical protein
LQENFFLLFFESCIKFWYNLDGEVFSYVDEKWLDNLLSTDWLFITRRKSSWIIFAK